jgi:hypothetical protein
MSMKKLLVIIALATVVAAPGFAQGPASQQQEQLSYERNNNTNPDFQLGGERDEQSGAEAEARQASHFCESEMI